MIDYLRKLGLSDLEARCYLTLNEEGNLSGYEIAKRVSTSRSNVYAALRSLLDKGACRLIEGDPTRYDAVPIEQLVRYFQYEFEQTTQTLVKELQSTPKSAAFFYNWQGTDSIEKVSQRLIANAEKSIVVDIWSEDVHWFEEALLHAENKGILVILITLGQYNTSLKNIIVHKRNDTGIISKTRKFSILCDDEFALLGSFGGELKPAALETNHPSVSEVLKVAFYQDLIMQHIEKDYGQLFADKYGESYEHILNHYLKKGWNI